MNELIRTPTLLEMKWRDQLCPFERVKKFKTGFSIKCPSETEVGWCSLKDESILNYLRTKRAVTCVKCVEKMKKFLGLGKLIEDLRERAKPINSGGWTPIEFHARRKLIEEILEKFAKLGLTE